MDEQNERPHGLDKAPLPPQLQEMVRRGSVMNEVVDAAKELLRTGTTIAQAQALAFNLRRHFLHTNPREIPELTTLEILRKAIEDAELITASTQAGERKVEQETSQESAKFREPFHIKVGDVVRLNSGGPKMSVGRVIATDENVLCFWIKDGDGGCATSTFPRSILTLVPPPPEPLQRVIPR